MKKSITIIKKSSFIYNENEYDFDRVDEIIDILKKDIDIIILEEELYAKYFNLSEKSIDKVNNFVTEKIEKEFPQNSDMVYDYDEDKRRKVIAIYSIKGRQRLEKISENAKEIDVKPIQFILREVMMQFLKNKIFTCNILVKFEECYYYISFKHGLFYFGLVEKNKDIICERIIENNDNEDLYIDDSVDTYKSLEEKFNIVNVNLGDLIYEKIFKKQKFYSR